MLVYTTEGVLALAAVLIVLVVLWANTDLRNELVFSLVTIVVPLMYCMPAVGIALTHAVHGLV